MSNVIAFAPRQRPPEPEVLTPLAGFALRAHLEGAAQTALDAADSILAALDRIEGSEGIETAPDPHPAVTAAQAPRVVHLREPATPIIAPDPPPETPPETPQSEPEPEPVAVPEIRASFPPLPWGGAGNVVAATGCALLALMAGAR